MKAPIGVLIMLKEHRTLIVVLNRLWKMHFISALLIFVFTMSFLVPLLGFSFVFAPIASLFVVYVGKLADIEAIARNFFLEESKFDEGPFILIRWAGTLIAGVLSLIFFLLKVCYFFIVVFPAAIGGALHDGVVISIKRYLLGHRFTRKAKEYGTRVHALWARREQELETPVGLEPPPVDQINTDSHLSSIDLTD